MSGSRLGGIKARNTNYERQGKDFYKRIGQIGGSNGHTCGIIVSKETIMNIKGYEEYQILSNGVALS